MGGGFLGLALFALFGLFDVFVCLVYLDWSCWVCWFVWSLFRVLKLQHENDVVFGQPRSRRMVVFAPHLQPK